MPNDQSALYEKLFLQLSIGVFVLNKEKKIIAWNDWLSERTKITSDKAINHTLSELIPHFNNARYEWGLDYVLKNKSPQVLSQILNKYLIPIRINNLPFQEIEFMQQHVEILPLTDENETYAVVTIFDETNSVYQKEILMRLGHELEQQTIRDELTKAYNRRFLWDWLINHFRQAKRDQHQIACCLLDLDHFKNINDQYGHEMGDQVLSKFVKLISSKIRGLDILVRYGGEEFIVMLYKTNQKEVLKYAERMRILIENTSFNPLPPKTITCSIGIALWSPKNPIAPRSFIKLADKALYEAKSSGRNCVRLTK